MNENKNYWGDMSYDEMWKAWSDKNNFGAKGELSLQEAKEVHAKWKRLGTEARLGLI